MKKIVIFVMIILVLGVLAMETCIQNSKRIEQEKNKEQIVATVDETTNSSIDYEEETNINENSAENIIVENKIIEQEKIETNQKKNTEVTKTVKEDTKIEQNTNKTNNKKEKEQTTVTEKSNTETKQEVKKDTGYTEVEVNVAQKKKCDGNNHKICAGNTGLWFNTEDEAIATYKAEIKKWGDQWTNNEISDDEYYKNCPGGYETWNCPYCDMWTLNYYLDK